MDRPYFCNHFKGPVISVVLETIYDFIHSFVDGISDYLKNLSIDTAESKHLDFIGKLTGFSRPYNPGDEIISYYLRYAEGYMESDVGAMQLADTYEEWSYAIERGVFSATPEGGYGSETTPATDETYRALLKALVSVETNINSRRAIYDICDIFLQSTDYRLVDDDVAPDRVTLVIGRTIERLDGIVLFALLLSCYKGVLDMRLHFEEDDNAARHFH